MCATSYWAQTDFDEVGQTAEGAEPTPNCTYGQPFFRHSDARRNHHLFNGLSLIPHGLSARKSAWRLSLETPTTPTCPNCPIRNATPSLSARCCAMRGFNSVDVIVNASNLEFKRAIRKFETRRQPGRCCRGVLRRSWPGDQRQELPDSDRCQTGKRPRRRGRSDHA